MTFTYDQNAIDRMTWWLKRFDKKKKQRLLTFNPKALLTFLSVRNLRDNSIKINIEDKNI